MARIEVLKNISGVTLKKSNGNIYKFDTPENDVILDWDALLENQPEHVKEAIEKIKQVVENAHLQTSNELNKFNSAKTGEQFYKALTALTALRNNDTKYEWYTDIANKKQTSMLFNKFGVPGLRFYDGMSRRKQKGTHNFVTWNVDMIKILGLTPDSDQEAIDYFNAERERQQQTEAESYNQTANDDKVRQNIERGNAAMNKVINEHTDVMNAMYRDDLGGISFFWGETGRGNKFKGGWGISHLIARRNQQGYNGETVARKMVDVIANGKITRHNGENIPLGERVDISYDKYTAVLSLYKDGNRMTWLLTGWENYNENSDASGEVYGSTSATLSEPTRFRSEEGAENFANSLAGNSDNVNNTSNFITEEQLERYEQLMLHGTPNILKNNRFDLQYLGTGEGGQMFGYGAYLAQEKDVANSYREHDEFSFFNKDEQEMSNEDFKDNLSAVRNMLPKDFRICFNTMNLYYNVAAVGKHWIFRPYQSIDEAVNASVKETIDAFKLKLKHEQKAIDKSQIAAYEKTLRDALEPIMPAKVKNFERKGNLYYVNGPEDYELLDWNKPMSMQPEKVLEALKNSGFKIHDNETGEHLYRRLSKKFGGGKQGDKQASLWLNNLDIPGHRYLDGLSRGGGDGTYNFVIWNTDTLEVLGMEGDEDAENYFNAERERQNKTTPPEFESYKNSSQSTQDDDFFFNGRGESYNQSNSFITDEQLEKYDQLMWHGTSNILNGNRFDLKYISSGEGAQAYGYGAYLAQERGVAESYRTAGIPFFEKSSNAIFKTKDGKEIPSWNLGSHLYEIFQEHPNTIIKNTNPFVLTSFLDDVANGGYFYKSIDEAVDAFIQHSASKWLVTKQEENEYSKILRDIIDPFIPVEVYPHKIKKGNLYSVDGPEDFELLDWDATMKEQPEQVLNKLRNSGFKIHDDETGGDLYRRLSKKFGGGKDGDKKASIWLNDLGIPGHRFFDGFSRDKKDGTHNFVIWNTDTLKVLGLEGDNDAEDYYRTEDYYNAKLDAIDNDSDVVDYSNADYEDESRRVDDYYNSYLDGLDNEPNTGESYNQSAHENKFMTPDALEQYNQLRTHATGNIIWGNRFDLKFVGSSEGGAAYGYGAYFEESPKVAESYRTFGLPDGGWGTLKVSTSDGKIYRKIGGKGWNYDDSTSNEIKEVLRRVDRYFDSGENIPAEKIKSELREQFNTALERFSKMGTSGSSGVYVKEIRKSIKKQIAILDRISQIDFQPSTKKGNIYTFDIPEDYELLDWDAPLSQQPEKVKKAIKKIVAALERRGYSKQEVLKNPDDYNVMVNEYDRHTETTGGDFYENIVACMEDWLKYYPKPKDGITRADARASFLLNKFGIPGHRFWDGQSRTLQEGTHNYVIWNMEKIKMVGISPDSDADAIRIFNDKGRRQLEMFDDESYNQPANKTLSDTPQTHRKKYQDTDRWLKAPNGKKSNLDENLWVLTRTQNFKNWFGDWENDPDNASKVLDDNGEPLVVYHGTPINGFSTFSVTGSDYTKGTGAWFTNSEQVAQGYVHTSNAGAIYSVFLNIRNPYVINSYGRAWSAVGDVHIENKKTGEIINSRDDGSPFNSAEDAENFVRYGLNDKFFEQYKVVHDKLMTTNDFVKAVRKKKLGDGEHDGVIFLNVRDSGRGNDPLANSYVVFRPNQIKSTQNKGTFNPKKRDIYYQPANLQDNPFIERYSQNYTFDNPETEKAFKKSREQETPKGKLAEMQHSMTQLIKGLRGDYPELATKAAKAKGLVYAREVLRKMGRVEGAKTWLAVRSLSKSLKHLDADKLDAFTRLMLINDIYNFKRYNPKAKLPMNFTPESLKSEREKFTRIAQNNPAIMEAVRLEHEAHEAIKQELSGLAEELGMKKFADKVRRYDYYVLDYARLLGGKGINANYIQAAGEFRTAQLKDIEHLQAIKALKGSYDKKDELIKKFGKDWRKHIPKGYSIFNPLKEQFVTSAHTLTENILGMALEQAGQEWGLSEETLNSLREKLSDNTDEHLLVLPEELTNTLNKMAEPPKPRGDMSKLIKILTNGWKKYVLYAPTRVFKYNFRNITGDADAAIAGNPQSFLYLGRAIGDLSTLYYGDSSKVSKELREFQKRGGAITIESTQELGDYKEIREFRNLISELEGEDASFWAKLSPAKWELIDKYMSKVTKFSDYREQWLRYANYLSYLDQMKKNNGVPSNWGASVKEEVMSLPDIRDRAFKMSSELLGAYDQISETGKAMRDTLVPFYSWLEVNAKRYYQLIKNGLTEDNAGDFVSRFLKGQLANAPYYAFKLGKTYLLINFLSLFLAAFNHFVWPDEEDELPPDVQARPHWTIGRDPVTGDVIYFDRVGAVLDNLEWFGQDNSQFLPFYKDIKDILDGRQTFTDFAGKLITAPIDKAVNAITPFVKTPMELLTGKSLYPSAMNPRNIRDGWQYLAQSFGLNWPYKAATGQPYSNWDEFRNLFVYGADADEAAYFYSLNLMRQFQEQVLGKKIGSFATTKRGQALQRLKTALRLDDKDAVQRYLQEYYRLGGDAKGLKASMRNMNPLHGLNKNEQAQFLKWISDDDRKYFNRANNFFHKIADRFLK